MATLTRSPHDEFDSLTADVPMRAWTVLAQDPSVLGPGGRALTTRVQVPAERLESGPKGHRIHVIDYDATRNVYYRPRTSGLEHDPFAGETDIGRLLADPQFHQQNVYAIAMSVLGIFQSALGRPTPWGFDSPAHQLKIAPHAFAEANAYYSRESESLSFGYFPGRRTRTVFTCLSHDIVAHETAHALLDGLRRYFLRPSHVDQVAFHEAFADIVALLSVLQSMELVEMGLAGLSDGGRLIRSRDLEPTSLRSSLLFGLAKEFGREDSAGRADALRRSVSLTPSARLLSDPDRQEEHGRGEILVAAVAQAFLHVWCKRLGPRGTDRGLALNRAVVAEEGATAAGQLLRIAIRALDYLPPVDLTFPDYLSALLTADLQTFPDDSKYGYRRTLRAAFQAFGIAPADGTRADGAWRPPPRPERLRYTGLHFEQMQSNPDTLFRFLWENRETLGLDRDAFTRVTAVRPCVRIGGDGLVLHETVVEYVQTLRLFARELERFGIRKPRGLSDRTFLPLYGGGTLLFDEFGRLKLHIGTGVRSPRQSERLQSLFDQGAFHRDADAGTRFAELHRRRMMGEVGHPEEQW
jgi:hypothetical protein